MIVSVLRNTQITKFKYTRINTFKRFITLQYKSVYFFKTYLLFQDGSYKSRTFTRLTDT